MSEPVGAQLKRFLMETNAVALAIGIVMGMAVTDLVNALVTGLVMPVISLLIPGGPWRDWAITLPGDNPVLVGEIAGATLDFLVISTVVYVVAVRLLGVEVKKG